MSTVWTGRTDAPEHLLVGGADIDTLDTLQDRAALMWAAVKGHTAFVRFLLAAGGNQVCGDQLRPRLNDFAKQ